MATEQQDSNEHTDETVPHVEVKVDQFTSSQTVAAIAMLGGHGLRRGHLTSVVAADVTFTPNGVRIRLPNPHDDPEDPTP